MQYINRLRMKERNARHEEKEKKNKMQIGVVFNSICACFCLEKKGKTQNRILGVCTITESLVYVLVDHQL